MSPTLPGGYDGNVMPDTEAVNGNPGPAASGTQYVASNVETSVTNADYFGTQTDTVTLNHLVAAPLHRVGIVTTAANLVVFDVTTSTPLVLTTDYTVATVGSGASQTYTLTRNNSSSASADGDSVTVKYQWGNDAAFSSASGEYGPSALKYGNYGDSASGLYPGISGTVDNEHVGLLVGGTQPTYTAEPLVPPQYTVTETDTTTVNWPPTPGVNPAYRAPNLSIGYLGGGGSADTTWTDRPLSDGTVRNDMYNTVGKTLDSYYVGAPTGLLTSADALTLTSVGGTALLHNGVVPASIVAVTNGGSVTAITDTLSGTNFNHTTPFALTHTGITTAAGSIVVTDTTTVHVLVSGTDYTLTPTGSGATAGYTIVRINSSVNSADNNTVTVAYSYGNAAHFATQPLVLTTDYTVATVGSGDAAVTSLTRASGSTVIANGDPVLVTYTYGDASYYNSNTPATAPAAPTIGAVSAQNEGVLVNWTAPAGTVTVNGYVVENSTYGTEYAAANATSMVFGGVNGHGELTPNVPYQFRVAAWNQAGVGPFSAWSASASALNTNAVPTGSLDPLNAVNPVYAPDGTVHASTGTGSGGGGPRPPTSVVVASTVSGRIDVTWAAPSNAGLVEEAPSGYTVAFSTGKVVTVGKTVFALNTTGFTSSSSVTVTVTAVGDIQAVSATPTAVTVA